MMLTKEQWALLDEYVGAKVKYLMTKNSCGPQVSEARENMRLAEYRAEYALTGSAERKR